MLNFNDVSAYLLYYEGERIYKAYIGEDLVFESYLEVTPVYQYFTADAGNGDEFIISNTEWEIN